MPGKSLSLEPSHRNTPPKVPHFKAGNSTYITHDPLQALHTPFCIFLRTRRRQCMGEVWPRRARSITSTDDNYPSDALHIWAENKPVNEYNLTKLEQIPSPQFTLKAIDQYPQNVTRQDINKVLSRGRSETGGLNSEILIKKSARVMLTTNIDIADRLINGQMGTIIKIEVNQNTQKPTVVYIKFDDHEAGRNSTTKCPNPFARENRVVPIEPVLTSQAWESVFSRNTKNTISSNTSMGMYCTQRVDIAKCCYQFQSK